MGIDEFDDVDQELDFFFDHAFLPKDRMFYGFNATKFLANMSDPAETSEHSNVDSSIVQVPQIELVDRNNETLLELTDSNINILTDQYPQMANDAMYMEAPREVFPSMIKFASCKFCPGSAEEMTERLTPIPSSLKLIQQTYKDNSHIRNYRPPKMRRNWMNPNMIPKSNQFSWVNNDQDNDDESAFQLIGKLYYFQAIVFPLDIKNLLLAKPYQDSQYLRGTTGDWDSSLDYMRTDYPRCDPDKSDQCQIIT